MEWYRRRLKSDLIASTMKAALRLHGPPRSSFTFPLEER